MIVPSLAQAQRLLTAAEQRNPGPWVQHSLRVAEAARRLAASLPTLDAEIASIMGLLHDIGRGAGNTSMRHIIDGYTVLMQAGYPDAARICLTHSFPVKDIRVSLGTWDCSSEEYQFVQTYLEDSTYDDYDRLIQLCDALSLAEGWCLLEKRLVDSALRYAYSVNETLVPRWQATLQLQQQFEAQLGTSIYQLLPGVVETTFGNGKRVW